MEKVKSIINKAKTISKNGLEPYEVGKYNFENPNEEIELLALERAKVCLNCDEFKKEPVDFLRVKDERIPELSEMVCGECWCLSPYKNRQSLTICNKWEK